jgi:hypothetical protein
MLAGVLSIDRVLLIVAADDGPRPQTLEHLDILELIGIGEITAIVTKIDRVGASAENGRGRARRICSASRFAEAPLFAVSSRTGEGIPALAEHLRESAARAARQRARHRPGGSSGCRSTAPFPARDRAGGHRDGCRRDVPRATACLSAPAAARSGSAACMRITGRSSVPAPASAAPSTWPAPLPRAPSRAAATGSSLLPCICRRAASTCG